MKTFTLLLSLVLLQQTVLSQSASPAYVESKNLIPPSAYNLSARAVTELPNGKYLSAVQRQSDSSLVVYRMNPDLTLDWVSTPVALTSNPNSYDIISIASDKSGRILVAGNYYTPTGKSKVSNLFVVAFDSLGNPEKSLNGNYKLKLPYTANDLLGGMAVQSDGKIVLAATSLSQITIYRLNSDGTQDKSFAANTGSYVFPMQGLADYATCIALDGYDNIYVGCYYLTATGGNGGSIVKLFKDGTPDPNFGKMGTGRSDLISGAISAIALQADGKVIVTSISGINILLVRADILGNLDPSFNGTGYYNYNYTGSSNNTVKGISIDPYGRIYISGSYVNAAGAKVYLMLKFFNSGQPDNNFNSIVIKNLAYSGSNSFYGSLITKDERLLLAGEESGSASFYRIYLKSDYPANGIIFNNFPQIKFIGDPSFEINTSPPNLVYTSTNDSIAKVKLDSVQPVGLGKADIVATIPGDSNYYPYSSSATLSVGRKSVFIVGKDFVTANSGAKYTIKDTLTASHYYYRFDWSYSDPNVAKITNPDFPQEVTLYFPDSAKTGTLTCTIYSEGFIAAQFDIYKQITVNSAQTGSTGVPGNTCDQNVISCTDNYIDNFTLAGLASTHTGCSESGYIDYTSSGKTATLYLGGVYTPNITLGGKDSINRYVAMWLDYDNSGDFNNTTEFLGAAFTSNFTVSFDNLLIKNNSDYAGPRRIRVRTRTNGGFDPNESCPVPNESGETEDYLVTLKVQDALEAPEIITPNNDGKNDYFVVRGINSKASNHLAVFDRLGLLKFESENYDNTWNGVDHNGNIVPQGTYYYVFKNGNETIRGFLEIRY